MKVGVINWNAILPRETYFGGYALQALTGEAYRDRLPYWCKLGKTAGETEFPPLTQEIVDSQLQYAIDAGIDYFAYPWYASEPLESEIPVSGREKAARWNELNAMRRLHQTSALRERIRLCAILRPEKLNDSDYAELAEVMQTAYYEKLDGRPLAIFMVDDASRFAPAAEKLDAACVRQGTAVPYRVFVAVTEPGFPCDAVTRYAHCAAADSWRAYALDAVEACEKQKASGRPVIPLFSAGWNPSPRIDRPVPWMEYPRLRYAPPPTGDGDMRFAAQAMQHWLEKNRKTASTGHILVYAWNEFEEGGYLCPTLGRDGAPDTTQLDAFAEAVRLWKYTQN